MPLSLCRCPFSYAEAHEYQYVNPLVTTVYYNILMLMFMSLYMLMLMSLCWWPCPYVDDHVLILMILSYCWCIYMSLCWYYVLMLMLMSLCWWPCSNFDDLVLLLTCANVLYPASYIYCYGQIYVFRREHLLLVQMNEDHWGHEHKH